MNLKSIFKGYTFDKYAFYVVCATVFLVPIIFVPSAWMSVTASKSLIITLGSGVAFILILIERIKSRTSIFSFKLPVFLLTFLFISYALSSFFSITPKTSFFGTGFDSDTATFILSVCLFSSLFFTSVLKSKKNIQTILIYLFSSLFLLFLYEFIRVFVRLPFLSFDSLGGIVSMAGNISEMGIIGAIFAVVLFFALDVLHFNWWQKVLVFIVGVASVSFVTLTNLFFNIFLFSFSIHWLTAIFSGLFVWFYYKFSYKGDYFLSKPKTPFFSIGLVLVSITFVFFGSMFSQQLSMYTKVVFLEVRPSWFGTIAVINNSLKDNLVLGSGPGTFELGWNKQKIKEFNETPFWNADFGVGVSTIATAVGSVGLLGLSAWLAIITLAIYLSIRLIRIALIENQSRNTDSLILFVKGVVLLYSSVVFLLYTPGVLYIFLFFILISSSYLYSSNQNTGDDESISNFKNIFNTSVCLVLIASILFWQFFIIKKASASVFVEKALRAETSNESIQYLNKALSLDKQSEYYIMLAQISLLELQNIVSKYADNPNISSEDKTKITNIITDIVKSASSAEEIGGANYRTFLSVGSIYESLAFYGLPNVYDSALAKYKKASTLSETQPLPYLLSARVETSRGDYNSAKKYIQKALDLKPNYSDAFILLSDIAVAEGNLKDAELYMEKARDVFPDSAEIYFALGKFRYNDKDYKSATKLFSESIKLNPNLVVARMALALSLYSAGLKDEAISEMMSVASQNPSQQVNVFLEKMKDGTLLKSETKIPESKSSDKPKK